MGCSWSSSSSSAAPHASSDNALKEKQYQTSGGGILSGKYDFKKPKTSSVKPAHIKDALRPNDTRRTGTRRPLPGPQKPAKGQTMPIACTPFYDNLPPKAQKCVVTSVYDGDTLTLSNKKRLRFLGIDTPELKNPTQAFSQEAKAYTESRCLNSKRNSKSDHQIWISYEDQGIEAVDRYGRLLAWVWVKRDEKGKRNQYECVNEGLVREGLASVYVPSKATKLQNMTKLLTMQQEARTSQRGMWYNFRARTVVQTPHGCAFHHPDANCEHLKRTPRESLLLIRENVAMDQGRHACRTCLSENDSEIRAENTGSHEPLVAIY